MKLWVNGEPHELDAPMTIAELLVHLGVSGERVAVERNLELVRRATRDAVRVTEGDHIEIVSFVGGG
jgi:sulfur carrier protein